MAISKRHKRAACLFSAALLTAALAAGCAPFGEKGQAESTPTDSGGQNLYTTPPAAPEVGGDAECALALSFLQRENAHSDARTYFADEAPDTPQEGDTRIDSMHYAGETPVYESVGAAYEIHCSRYVFTRTEDMEKLYAWHEYDPFYIVLRRSGYDNTWDGVFGRTEVIAPDKDINEVILEVAYNLQDIEVSLRLEGYPQLVGPFSAPNFFNEESTVEKMEGWEPIYREGDYWMQFHYNGLTALCYYSASEDAADVYRIETTRPDVATYRGLHVGAPRSEVLAAYPNIYDTPYWLYGGDFLWYCDNEDGWGAALLFWFEDDMVSKIELISMFD